MPSQVRAQMLPKHFLLTVEGLRSAKYFGKSDLHPQSQVIIITCHIIVKTLLLTSSPSSSSFEFRPTVEFFFFPEAFGIKDYNWLNKG